MAKVKVNIDLKSIRKEIVKESKKSFKPLLKRLIIDESIAKGISPVKGKRRYKAYSRSYRDQIRAGRYRRFRKSVRPVNLKLSGELHKSFFVSFKNNRIVIGFKNKLADIHNRLGAGKSKVVRRMLPTRPKEEFNRRISKGIRDELKDIISKVLRRRTRR